MRPIGPRTESGDQPSSRREWGTSPADGRKPTTPHFDAGMRSDPPVSDPVQTGSMSHASAAAEPPDEPPAFSSGLNGLPVAPHTTLRVLAPAPSSGTLVFATRIAPAARSRATIATSREGTLPRDIGEPYVVRRPAVSSRSFTPSGRPCSKPSGSPFNTARSAAFAASRACS